MAGLFISLEGGEGAGKSTQIRRLRDRLEAGGHRVTATREPGGSERAEFLREVLLCGDAKRFGPFAETLLFASARADHVDRTIRPALSSGHVVLCDRFTDSTRVYQGALGQVPPDAVAALERVAVRGTRPDLTLVLDVPPAIGMARAGARRGVSGQAPDRFEGEGMAYHGRIREGFLAIAAAEPERCVVIDAAGTPDEAADAIWRAVELRLPGRPGPIHDV